MTESLFLDPTRSGAFFLPPRHREAVQLAANDAGKHVLAAHLESGDKDGALHELGRALRFPDWYGANLDALYDCLTDPDWQAATGQVLLLSGFNELQHSDPESFSILIDVFRAAADACLAAGKPLWVLLDTPAPGLPSLSIS